jgi:hypothetical protein
VINNAGENKSLQKRVNGLDWKDVLMQDVNLTTTRLQVGGHAVFLQKAPIAEKAKGATSNNTLSITEAELICGTDCA